MRALRNRAVLAFLLFNLLAGVLFVGGALLVSFMRSFGTTPAQLGLILTERRANAIYYRANVDHFLFPELKRIILKTEAVGDKLREALSALDDIRAAFIYGSTARGTELASSDIDLMIIGDVDLEALDAAIDRIEEELGRTVNYTLFDVEEWRERVAQGHAFVTDVLTHEKIFLIGDEDELSALATGGVD